MPVTPTTVSEPSRWRHVAVGVAVAAVCLVLPGTVALVLRPDNPGEGYVALALAVVVLAWQGYRLAASGVVVADGCVRRRGVGSRPVDAGCVRWRARPVRSGPALWDLVGEVEGRPVRLTRWPAREEERDVIDARLRRAGVVAPVTA